MFKNPLTSQVVGHFIDRYQSLPHPSKQDSAYVYVDPAGVKYITQVFDDEEGAFPQGVFALSVAGDGWMEMLALEEAES